MSADYEHEHLTMLARQLADATSQRRARWETRDAHVYSWTAPEGVVAIASRDHDGEPPYELSIYNSDGEAIDALSSELLADDFPAPWNEPLAELYRTARRSALGADDLIDALIDRLRDASGDDAAAGQRSFFKRARVGAETDETA